MAIGDNEKLRLGRARRDEARFEVFVFDELVPTDAIVREIWDYVQGLDLKIFYNDVKSRQYEAGRPAIDPALLLALWLYATLDGVGSARLLERLCERDASYRWLCGGVSVNHHSLSDFRTASGPFLDDLLTRSMTGLVAAGCVDITNLGVDGVRVRASAGASSFRSAGRLEELEAKARGKLDQLRQDLETDPATDAKRRRAREEQETKARVQRIAKAREAAAQIEAAREEEARRIRRREPKNKGKARASTTDPQARIMCMADGGFRPAYNFQYKTTLKHSIVLGFDVTNKAADQGQLDPALDEIERRYKGIPPRVLADSGYVSKGDIERASTRGVEVFSPLPSPKKDGVDPSLPKSKEGPGVCNWRLRMSQKDNIDFYKQRFACERPHADARNRGLQRLTVRGLEKVKAVGLLFVTAYNFMQIRRLWPRLLPTLGATN
jgi:transposase